MTIAPRRFRPELAEAKRLREEAEAVLQSFKRKAAAAETEAASIVAQARTEAEMMAKEAETRMTVFVARRTKQAETKIVIAETQATADVRAAASDAAVAIAGRVFSNDPQGTGVASLIDREIQGLRGQAELTVCGPKIKRRRLAAPFCEGKAKKLRPAACPTQQTQSISNQPARTVPGQCVTRVWATHSASATPRQRAAKPSAFIAANVRWASTDALMAMARAFRRD